MKIIYDVQDYDEQFLANNLFISLSIAVKIDQNLVKCMSCPVLVKSRPLHLLQMTNIIQNHIFTSHVS